MSSLSVGEYDVLERAIAKGERVVFIRRGSRLAVVPLRLQMVGRDEVVFARQPSTGEAISFALSTVERVEVPR